MVKWTTDKIAPLRSVWTSNRVYLITQLIYAVYQTHHYQNSAVALGNHIQFASAFMCVLLVCVPIQYMQTMVGQYSRSSAITLRYMCPIIMGTYFCFILLCYLRLVREAIVGGDAILYLFNSVQSHPPWLTCRSKDPTCWYDFECTQATPCLNANTHLAASKYWNETFMGFDGAIGSAVPNTRRLVTTMLIWILVYVNLFVSKSLTNKFLQYTFVVTIVMRVIILGVLIMVSQNGLIGFLTLFATDYQDLLNIYSWSRQLVAMLCYMSIGKGCNIMLGSLFTSDHLTGLLTVISVVCISVINIVIIDTYFVAVNNIATIAGLKVHSLDIIGSVYESVEFTIIPAGLGYTTLAPFWNIIYFLTMMLHAMCHIIINLRIIQVRLEDAFPILAQYRNYILVLSFLVYCSLTIIFVTSGLHLYTITVLGYALDLFEVLITLVFVASVAWTYGVQIFSDDIHFIAGSQPARFWKVTWYLSPVFICLGLIFYIVDTESMNFLGAHEKIFVAVVEIILISPLWSLALVQMFRYTKNRNFLGVFQMTSKWGPPDPIERQERKIFNPRKETKSRRRQDRCQHKCLLKSKVLQLLLDEEALRQYIDDENQKQFALTLKSEGVPAEA